MTRPTENPYPGDVRHTQLQPHFAGTLDPLHDWQPVPWETTQGLLADLGTEFPSRRLAPDRIRLRRLSLPFYGDRYACYRLTDLGAKPAEELLMLYRPGEVHLLEGRNAPIYEVNKLAPIRLTPETALAYTRFFFQQVGSSLGCFVIVERVKEIAWLPSAKPADRAQVAGLLQPLSYQGVGADGRLQLSATVIFRDALFRTEIYIAPREMTAPIADPAGDEPGLMTYQPGQMELANGELLLEDLPVTIALGPSDE